MSITQGSVCQSNKVVYILAKLSCLLILNMHANNGKSTLFQDLNTKMMSFPAQQPKIQIRLTSLLIPPCCIHMQICSRWIQLNDMFCYSELMCLNFDKKKVDMFLNSSQLAKMRSTFLTCPCQCCHEIYRIDAVGFKKFQLYFKTYNFCEYVKFGAIPWKFDILLITANHSLDLIIFLHMRHTLVRLVIFRTPHFDST